MTRSNFRVLLSVVAVLSWFTVGTQPAAAALCNGVTADVVLTNGDDVLTAAASPTADVIVGLAGNDTLTGGAGNDRICGGSGNDNIFVDDPAPNDTPDTAFGGSGNDTIDGNGDALADMLFGESGDDIFIQGPADHLDGGSGTDDCAGLAASKAHCP